MSFIHFDATTAASAEAGMVNLENMICDDNGQFGASAGIIFFSYGETWCIEGNGGDTQLYFWIDPVDATPGNPVYQMKRNLGSGSVQPSGPASEVWTDATSFLGFGWNVNFGGSGYVTGDTIDWVGGTFETPVQATVIASGGAVTGISVFNNTGNYGLLPTDPIASTATSGVGTGATFNGNAAFDHRCSWGFSVGYGEDDHWDGIISIRKGTGPVLDTATISIDADAD